MGAIFCTFRHDSMHAWNWVHYIKADNKGARLSTPIFVSFCQSAARAHVYINAVRMACAPALGRAQTTTFYAPTHPDTKNMC